MFKRLSFLMAHYMAFLRQKAIMPVWLKSKNIPRPHLFAVAVLFIASLVIIVLPSENMASTRDTSIIEIEVKSDLHANSAIENSEENNKLQQEQQKTVIENWQTIIIKKGDSLSTLFKQAGLSANTLYQIVSSSKEAKQLSKIRPGQKIAFLLNEDKQVEKLRLTKNRLDSIQLTKNEQGYHFEELTRSPEIFYAFRQGNIKSSLFMSAKKAGLTDNLTMELANIFGWDIDFMLDMREGDSFALFHEELFIDGEKIDNGNIIAAEFINRGHVYRAVLYTDKNNNQHYYTPEGLSMRKEFLRSPVDFARISSHFNLKRKHPVLHKIRAHKGTDYAASRGTPVRATGDGKVIHAKRKGGYGNAVIIKHGQKYQTLYAHLDKFRRGIKSGKRVKQGQIIGYVGSTGLATGPHLHYEFYVNGAVRNPVTVKLPNAKHIAKEEKSLFLTQTQKFIVQLATYTQSKQATQLASAE